MPTVFWRQRQSQRHKFQVMSVCRPAPWGAVRYFYKFSMYYRNYTKRHKNAASCPWNNLGSLRHFLYCADISDLVRCLMLRPSLFRERRSALQYRHCVSRLSISWLPPLPCRRAWWCPIGMGCTPRRSSSRQEKSYCKRSILTSSRFSSGMSEIR